MSTEKQARLQACLTELASLLYEQTDKSKLIDLENIEKTVRTQMLEQVSPEIALFLLKKQRELKQGRPED